MNSHIERLLAQGSPWRYVIAGLAIGIVFLALWAGRSETINAACEDIVEIQRVTNHNERVFREFITDNIRIRDLGAEVATKEGRPLQAKFQREAAEVYRKRRAEVESAAFPAC